ncbi:MAG: AhpC/TSA family protein [Myxococcales bacterium FL481]|nr:MAG: AhpC/TSA family protein [Myxococcales bacterium FL481]
MSLQDELDQLRERVEGNLPPPSLKVVREAIAALKRAGIEAGVVKVGETAPAFALPNQDGRSRALDEALRRGPLVLTFYRGVWCSYCNADLKNLQRYVPQLEAAGASLLAISPELPEFSMKMIRTRKLTFDILSDAHSHVAAAYGLRWKLGEELKLLYRDHLNVNLTRYHGNDDWTLPMPARFVVRPDGVVAYAEADADYRRRPDPDQLLEIVRAAC